MRRKSFSSLGFERHHKTTRRERFLSEMEVVVPWAAVSALIEPHYPPRERGRPPIKVERMLRIHFLQLWYNLSDPAMEEALYDRSSFQQFIGIDGFTMPPPDETSICRFRHFS